MESIFDKLETNSITVYEYKEDNTLCGYELDTYTNNGINMVLFIDYRDTDLNPLSENHFIKLFKERVSSFDIDQEIDLLRHDKRFRDSFSIRESLNDLELWRERLESLF
jgi:hypothetical protein